jgi:Uma2 family endonuclease
MSVEHGYVALVLAAQLDNLLDDGIFRVRFQHARLRISSETYYVPDVVVISTAAERERRQRLGSLDTYRDPVPLVVDVWPPSTGDYDIRVKLAGYHQPGDWAIWSLEPYDCTLTAWRRQPDGRYAEFVDWGATARPASLPDVTIDLDALCAG